MKKALFVFVFIFVVGVCLVYFLHERFLKQGKTGQTVIEYGTSQKFSKAEIQTAMDCVLKEFKSFKGCDLKKLWYDEKLSNKEYGNSTINAIVLLSNFSVDAFGADIGFEPTSEQTNYKWLLVRDNKSSEWLLKSSGYA